MPRSARHGAGLAAAVVLIGAVTALAAVAHFRSGGLYTGRSSACGSSVPGTTCVFRFRAAKGGRSLKFVGETVIATWGCGSGGGEAMLGGAAKNATPIPIIKLSPEGTLHGSTNYVFRPSSAPAEHLISSVTGHISRAGKAASVTFHQASQAGGPVCSTAPVTLTEKGSSQGGPH